MSENRFLSKLPAAEKKHFERFEPVEFKPGDLVYRAGDWIGHVYFLEQGLVAPVKASPGGLGLNLSYITPDGLFPITGYCLGRMVFDFEAQTECRAQRLPIEVLKKAADKDLMLRRRLLSVVRIAWEIFGQVSLCNRAHSAEERCVRLLLLMSDASRTVKLDINVERLAGALGISSRTTLWKVSGRLDEAGVTHHGTDYCEILDRRGLEAHGCECYGIIRQLLDTIGQPADALV